MARQQFRLEGDREVIDRRRDDGGVPHTLVETVLQQIDRATGQLIMTSLDFNRVVGEAKYVRVQPDDVFVFARRPGNKWQTRFVVDRKVEPTRFVTVVLAPNSPGRSGTYLLIASYFGFLSQPEVEDEEAFQWYENPAGAKIEAAAYWAMHAHVLGADDIMCPTCGEKKIRDDEVKGLCREGVVKCVNCWKRK